MDSSPGFEKDVKPSLYLLMTSEIKDRSLGYENTVLLEFETGHTFRIPTGMTVREAASHLLTPTVDEEVEKLIKRIYEAGEKQVLDGEKPDFTIQVNNEPASMETVLETDSKIQIQDN